MTPVSPSPAPPPPFQLSGARIVNPVSLRVKLLRHTVLAVLIMVTLALSGGLFWWADYFANILPHLSFFLIILLGITIYVSEMKQTLFCVLGLLMAGATIYGIPTQALPETLIKDAPPGVLRVIHVNVEHDQPTQDTVTSWLSGKKGDLVVLTQANRSWIPTLDKMQKELPYRYIFDNTTGYGAAVLSRYPLDASTPSAAGPKGLPVLKLDVETPLGRITVLAVHASAPLGKAASYDRNLYFRQVAGMAASNNQPTLIVGTFNAAPWSMAFAKLNQLPHRQPSPTQAPPTWPASFGSSGIASDHILLSLPASGSLPILMASLTAGPALDGLSRRPLIADLEIEDDE